MKTRSRDEFNQGVKRALASRTFILGMARR
jgi:hypothetical protein